MPTVELQAGLNQKGASHAARLIKEGAVSQSGKWSGPSAEKENAYISREGWAAYGTWFMGVDNEVDADTKGHYKYPFSDDFKTVSLNGIRAIRVRSAQNDETEIFDAAGRLMDAARAKIEARCIRSWTFKQGPQNVDMRAGKISDISIISEGEARGHGIMVTPKTLRAAAAKLINKSLPAYISHANAQGDRLLSEVGIFSGFYLDGGCEHAPFGPDYCDDKRKKKKDDEYPDQFPSPDARGKARRKERRKEQKAQKALSIRARNFTAFDSFRKYEPQKYDRLFELAEAMPDAFGVSMVFEGRLFWELEDDAEVEYMGMNGRPEESLFEWPSVEMLSIQSADFVDSPAANKSLFSFPTLNLNPITEMIEESTPEKPEAVHVELDGSASEEHEKLAAKAAAESGAEPEAQAEAEPEPPKKKRKRKLEEGDGSFDAVRDSLETPTGDPMELAVAEYQTRIEERDKLISELTANLDESRRESTRLRGLIEGAEPVEEDCAPVEELKPDAIALKDQAIKDYLEAHPGETRANAIIETYKANPALFSQN